MSEVREIAESKTVLVLRTCNADLSSHNGFNWRESGVVEAPDWNARPECGGGLHGLLWGEGEGDLLNWDADAKWLVCAVKESSIVDIGGKIKFPRCEVVHCGDRLSATSYLASNGGAGRAIVGGTATAGNYGTATAGDGGTATAGDDGTATAGYGGTATAGNYGTIVIKRWDGNRYRVMVGYIGENGLLPNVAYRLDEQGRFVLAQPSIPDAGPHVSESQDGNTADSQTEVNDETKN